MSAEKNEKDIIYSVANGVLKPLIKVNDPIFAEEMMGKGVAIDPTVGEIYAPFDSEEVTIFPTNHAISMKSKGGCELLIHVGINTVHLNGQFFNPLITNGEPVKAGDLIMKFDLDKIKEAGYDIVIPIVILNSDEYKEIDLVRDLSNVERYDELFCLSKKQQVEKSSKKNLYLEEKIVSNLGGVENIQTIGHCATRLRVTVKDDSLINRNGLESTEGVLGIVNSMGGIQIIIGNNVTNIYSNIRSNYSISNINLNDDEAVTDKKSLPNKILNVLSDILSPVIPLIMGSGFVSALLVILARIGISTDSGSYIFLDVAANVVFYFLPIMLAYTSSIRFKTNTIYALFIGGVLLHPTIVELAQSGNNLDIFKIPVTLIDYSSSLIPIILSVWVLSYVEKFVDRVVPDAAKYVFKPLLIILIMIPIVLSLTGPAGYLIGEGLGAGLTLMYNQASWLAIIVVATFTPLLVMTGMHIALTPLLILTNFETLGYDNLLLIGFIGMNFSQFAVALAVALKTKNKKLRQIATSGAFTTFLSGITEPTLYGVSIKLKKPFYATFIGCLANGIFCAIAGVKVFSFAAPSFSTLPIFMNPDNTNTNFILALCAIGITITVTFIATWILGFDDSVYE